MTVMESLMSWIMTMIMMESLILWMIHLPTMTMMELKMPKTLMTMAME